MRYFKYIVATSKIQPIIDRHIKYFHYTFDITFCKLILIYYSNIKHSVVMISREHPNIMLNSLWLVVRKVYKHEFCVHNVK